MAIEAGEDGGERSRSAVLSTELVALEVRRSAQHADLLRTVRRLQAELTGWADLDATTDQLELDLRCGEYRARNLQAEAHLLTTLPTAMDVLAAGDLTVEQVGVLRELLEPLDEAARLRVWERVLAGLADGTLRQLPPSRWRARVRRWVVQADPEAAAKRRRTAEAVSARVEYRRRDDGLVDLWASGLTAPNAHACLDLIARRSAPIGPEDERSADQRRLDAFVDLLTGRDRSGCRSGRHCDCPSAAPVPCGQDVALLVPVGAALGTTDEAAELVGHGPLEPDLLDAALHASPRLRVVWVDEHGTPVAISDQTATPPRGDRAAVRETLLRLVAEPPPPRDRWLPRHPHDHLTADDPATSPGPAVPPVTSPQHEGDVEGPRTSDEDASTGPARALHSPPGDPGDEADPVEPDRADHDPRPHDPVAQRDHAGASGDRRGRRHEDAPAGDDGSPQPEGPDQRGAEHDPTQDEPAGHSSGAGHDQAVRDRADHGHSTDEGESRGSGAAASPDRRDDRPGLAGQRAPRAVRRRGAHPAGARGAYRVPPRLRRFLRVRAPRCEWPGCGARAVRCDLDHDVAWPQGPTCACNLGPLCRHHHRVKQLGWTKTRGERGGVVWTSPSGQRYLSPSQHLAPEAPVRPLPPLPVPDPLDLLSALEREQELWLIDPGAPEFDGCEPGTGCDDVEPPDVDDMVGARLRGYPGTAWTLDLADHTAWEPPPSRWLS